MTCKQSFKLTAAAHWDLDN